MRMLVTQLVWLKQSLICDYNLYHHDFDDNADTGDVEPVEAGRSVS